MIIRNALAIATTLFALALSEGTALAAPELTRLFEQGRALVKEGQYEAAIPKFLESIAIEPTVGALLNLGDCYEHTGKPASARKRFLEAAELAGEADASRSAEARARAAKLDGVVARLVLVRRGFTDGQEPRITIDGELLTPRTERVEVDPGTHEIVIIFSGAPTDRRSVQVRTAQALDVIVEPASKAAPDDRGVTKPPAPASKSSASDGGSGWSGQQYAAIAVGGVGVVALGVGAAFGVVALGKQSDLDGACPNYPRCPDAQRADVKPAYDDASSAATIATVSVIAGVALVATGVVLWMTAPDKRATVGSSGLRALSWGLTF